MGGVGTDGVAGSARGRKGMTNVQAIMAFFGVRVQELKPLTKQDREELGALCKAALSES